MRGLLSIIGILLLCTTVLGDNSIKPGIKVTLNAKFFKTAISNLIDYMGQLKISNNICKKQDGTIRHFNHTTPLFTLSMTCSNFQFKQLNMTKDTSGVQFLDSAKAIKLVFYEFKTNFTFDYNLTTSPFKILKDEYGSVSASFNKINLIVKLSFDLKPQNLFGLHVNVSSVLIYNAKANQSLNITSPHGHWSQELNQIAQQFLRSFTEKINDFLQYPIQSYLQKTLDEMLQPANKQLVNQTIAQNFTISANISLTDPPDIHSDYITFPISGGFGAVNSSSAINVTTQLYRFYDPNNNAPPLQVYVTATSIQSFLNATADQLVHYMYNISGFRASVGQIGSIIGADYDQGVKNFTKNDLTSFAIVLPKAATNKIDFSCGDVYQVQMPANFSIWAIDQNKTIISKLLDVTFSINSILNVKYQDSRLTGKDYFLNSNLTSAYSYYPDCITSQDLYNKFKTIQKESVLSFDQIIKDELQKGITFPFSWPFKAITMSDTRAEVMDQYVEFQSNIAIDYASIIKFLFSQSEMNVNLDQFADKLPSFKS